jgi:hypothetical protein
MTRQTKTPRQRAAEALASANRTVVRLDRKLDALKVELATVEREHTDALRRRDYLASNPDLYDPTGGVKA